MTKMELANQIAKLIDGRYRLSKAELFDSVADENLSIQITTLLEDNFDLYKEEEGMYYNRDTNSLANLINRWLFLHGNECVCGHYGSADCERKLAVESIVDEYNWMFASNR